MRVLAYDPLLAEAGLPVGAPSAEFVTLDDLLAQSDFVSSHAPSLPETYQLFNAERFAKMKPTAYFINTARGALVNEADLLAALESDQIAGAAIDVYQQEPLPSGHPLRNAPRCVITPHNAFNAVEAAAEMSRLSAESVLALQQGQRPSFVCNPAVWESPALRSLGGKR
jgi:phosphoglycerate dehydrogenase-like enzyme